MAKPSRHTERAWQADFAGIRTEVAAAVEEDELGLERLTAAVAKPKVPEDSVERLIAFLANGGARDPWPERGRFRDLVVDEVEVIVIEFRPVFSPTRV